MDQFKSILDTFVERHAQHLWAQGAKLDVDKGLDFGNNVGYITNFSIQHGDARPNDEERTFGIAIIEGPRDVMSRTDCTITMKDAMVVKFYAKFTLRNAWVCNSFGESQVYEFEWSAFPMPITNNPQSLL